MAHTHNVIFYFLRLNSEIKLFHHATKESKGDLSGVIHSSHLDSTKGK